MKHLFFGLLLAAGALAARNRAHAATRLTSPDGWDLVSVSTLLSDVSHPAPATTVHSVGDLTATVRSEGQYLRRRRGQ